MKFKVNSEMEYSVHFPSTLIFNVHALKMPNQMVLEESLIISPELKVEEFTSGLSANRFARVQINEPVDFKISYKAVADVGHKLIDLSKPPETASIVPFDGNIIPFLFPSRYCQSDKLQRLAYHEFGSIENVYAKVLAITDWINKNVEYLSGSSTSQTSAHDTITERAGVCRDFAHLGIALCRALTIPARYFTAYAFKLNPPDFHACFEAYIDGNWIIFDATRLAPLNGLVKIATGRDAADAAVASIFGSVLCNYINVECDTLESDFVPFYYDESKLEGLSYQ